MYSYDSCKPSSPASAKRRTNASGSFRSSHGRRSVRPTSIRGPCEIRRRRSGSSYRKRTQNQRRIETIAHGHFQHTDSRVGLKCRPCCHSSALCCCAAGRLHFCQDARLLGNQGPIYAPPIRSLAHICMKCSRMLLQEYTAKRTGNPGTENEENKRRRLLVSLRHRKISSGASFVDVELWAWIGR